MQSLCDLLIQVVDVAFIQALLRKWVTKYSNQKWGKKVGIMLPSETHTFIGFMLVRLYV